jgi:crotonobetaine/carnitine-CoA ligase
MFSGLPHPSQWSLPAALTEMAHRRADDPWLIEIDGETLTFGRMHQDARRIASMLAASGVQRGDRVGIFMDSGCDFARAWMGTGLLGAVAVMFNPELRAGFLRHQIAHAQLGALVVDAGLLDPLLEIADALPASAPVWTVGDHSRPLPENWRTGRWAAFRDHEPWQGVPPGASDLACVMYTSGTSGPSKGVLMPHAHCVLYGVGAIESLRIDASDRYYITLPLFHANGLLMQLGATLLAGIPAVVRCRFSASRWLEDVRRHRCTLTNLLGATAAFVIARPGTPADGDHGLRAIVNAPNLPAHDAVLRERFGVRDVISGFGMTESNIPIWGRLGRPAPGAAGWVHEHHFEVRIADPATDEVCERGTVGEIQVRPRVPFGFMAGYLHEPAKTVEAWRNLWFHTGDAGVMDTQGLVTFVDRIKDCIRRRGENIAPVEIEAVLLAVPDVVEAVAYAVDAEIPGAEDEVMVALVGRDGQPLALAAVATQARARLPRFAMPRFIVQLDEIPRTATGKAQRAVLRGRGTHGAFDVELLERPRAMP